MSYDLYGRRGILTISHNEWVQLLNLAKSNGWLPKVTINYIIEELPWDGSYLSNRGQIITRSDAFQLGTALEKSLDDIPDDVDPAGYPFLIMIAKGGSLTIL
jgi:hypothetical protein